jgi:hypothetical protein
MVSLVVQVEISQQVLVVKKERVRTGKCACRASKQEQKRVYPM